MNVILQKWTLGNQEQLVKLCNSMDRTYLGNQIPYPYTKKDAEWWMNMSLDKEGVDGIFRAIVCEVFDVIIISNYSDCTFRILLVYYGYKQNNSCAN